LLVESTCCEHVFGQKSKLYCVVEVINTWPQVSARKTKILTCKRLTISSLHSALSWQSPFKYASFNLNLSQRNNLYCVSEVTKVNFNVFNSEDWKYQLAGGLQLRRSTAPQRCNYYLKVHALDLFWAEGTTSTASLKVSVSYLKFQLRRWKINFRDSYWILAPQRPNEAIVRRKYIVSSYFKPEE
jgi:hypothetical protein